MLFFGQALNNFNVCILEVEEFGFIELTYYNNSNATDFSECFVIRFSLPILRVTKLRLVHSDEEEEAMIN